MIRFQMKYGKHLISTHGNDQLHKYLLDTLCGTVAIIRLVGMIDRENLKTANIYPHVFEAKSRKFDSAKIFCFTVCALMSPHRFL